LKKNTPNWLSACFTRPSGWTPMNKTRNRHNQTRGFSPGQLILVLVFGLIGMALTVWRFFSSWS
jgi:hypothetical protein